MRQVEIGIMVSAVKDIYEKFKAQGLGDDPLALRIDKEHISLAYQMEEVLFHFHFFG